MLTRLVKLFAYSRAPKSTFALLHPVRALKWGAGLFLVKKIWDTAMGAKDEKRARQDRKPARQDRRRAR